LPPDNQTSANFPSRSSDEHILFGLLFLPLLLFFGSAWEEGAWGTGRESGRDQNSILEGRGKKKKKAIPAVSPRLLQFCEGWWIPSSCGGLQTRRAGVRGADQVRLVRFFSSARKGTGAIWRRGSRWEAKAGPLPGAAEKNAREKGCGGPTPGAEQILFSGMAQAESQGSRLRGGHACQGRGGVPVDWPCRIVARTTRSCATREKEARSAFYITANPINKVRGRRLGQLFADSTPTDNTSSTYWTISCNIGGHRLADSRERRDKEGAHRKRRTEGEADGERFPKVRLDDSTGARNVVRLFSDSTPKYARMGTGHTAPWPCADGQPP